MQKVGANDCSMNTSPSTYLDNLISSLSVVPVPDVPVLPHRTRGQGAPRGCSVDAEVPIFPPLPSGHLSHTPLSIYPKAMWFKVRRGRKGKAAFTPKEQNYLERLFKLSAQNKTSRLD